MKNICLTFQIHQPYRLKNFHFFDIGNHSNYFNDELNAELLHKVAKKSYLPANQLLLNLIKTYGKKIQINFAISGTALDQMEQYEPAVLKSFIELAKTGNVEFLGQTYSNSLSSLQSKSAFNQEVLVHKKRIESLFNQSPKVFFNTSLMYSNNIAELISELGFEGDIIEGSAQILQEKSNYLLYTNKQTPSIKLLIRNQSLSNDISLRFSWKEWSEWPLTADKYMSWLNALKPQDSLVNIVIDYATFGEYNRQESGIFSFLEYLIKYIVESKDFNLSTTQSAINSSYTSSKLDIVEPISWSESNNGVKNWLGNDLQKEAINRLYSLEKQVEKSIIKNVQKEFSYLQSADHFYYMNEEDHMNLLSPYDNPYDAFLTYMNVLSDFEIKLKKQKT